MHSDNSITDDDAVDLVRTVHLRITNRYAAELYRYLPAMLDALSTEAAQTDELIIDLSGVQPGPFSAELAYLCRTASRILPKGTPITIVGASAAVTSSLLAGHLPAEVHMSRARRSRIQPAAATATTRDQ